MISNNYLLADMSSKSVEALRELCDALSTAKSATLKARIFETLTFQLNLVLSAVNQKNDILGRF